ncbi:MAG: glutamate--tRNA ligase [Candidatus Omnitrophica bacterium]|nr:glutamate--tRNA ligase [Candidatus Omnitrophota bacterium]
MIRVRFAPSPTGYLHIGGVRTALFNYLYAKNQGGAFLVRIEDTDRERSTLEFENEIIEALQWLGLQSDEAIIRQSERLERYREVAAALVTQGAAYEEIKDGKTALRMKMPHKKASFFDLVHGEVTFDTSLFDDLVIIKSDGFPTYHFACVIDDHDMQVSHVIRGDDHLSNTPRHLMIYETLGWKAPKYAHLPLILGHDGSPLSKRHGAVSLTHYRKEGYLPGAFLNYLALLGWGTDGNQEFYTLEQLVKKFSLKKITKSNARFDGDKCAWLNGQHLKKLSDEDYIRQMSEFWKDEKGKFSDVTWRKLLLLYKDRVKTLKSLADEAGYCFAPLDQYDMAIHQTLLSNYPRLKEFLAYWVEKAQVLENFEHDTQIEQLTRDAAGHFGVQAKEFIHPLRFAIAGKTVSPGLFELMSVLGKTECLGRLRGFLALNPQIL